MPPRSSLSARTGGRGRKIVRQQGLETKPFAPPGIMVERSGSVGPDTTPAAGLRRRCAASSPWQARRRKRPRPPDRRNLHPRRPHEPLQRPRHRQDRPRGMTSVGKGQVTPQAGLLQQHLSAVSMGGAYSAFQIAAKRLACDVGRRSVQSVRRAPPRWRGASRRGWQGHSKARVGPVHVHPALRDTPAIGGSHDTIEVAAV